MLRYIREIRAIDKLEAELKSISEEDSNGLKLEIIKMREIITQMRQARMNKGIVINVEQGINTGEMERQRIKAEKRKLKTVKKPRAHKGKGRFGLQNKNVWRGGPKPKICLQ